MIPIKLAMESKEEREKLVEAEAERLRVSIQNMGLLDAGVQGSLLTKEANKDIAKKFTGQQLTEEKDKLNDKTKMLVKRHLESVTAFVFSFESQQIYLLLKSFLNNPKLVALFGKEIKALESMKNKLNRSDERGVSSTLHSLRSDIPADYLTNAEPLRSFYQAVQTQNFEGLATSLTQLIRQKTGAEVDALTAEIGVLRKEITEYGKIFNEALEKALEQPVAKKVEEKKATPLEHNKEQKSRAVASQSREAEETEQKEKKQSALGGLFKKIREALTPAPRASESQSRAVTKGQLSQFGGARSGSGDDVDSLSVRTAALDDDRDDAESVSSLNVEGRAWDRDPRNEFARGRGDSEIATADSSDKEIKEKTQETVQISPASEEVTREVVGGLSKQERETLQTLLKGAEFETFAAQVKAETEKLLAQSDRSTHAVVDEVQQIAQRDLTSPPAPLSNPSSKT